MKKIKILHIIKTLGLGGAEVNLFNLVNATDPDRFEVHVAYSAGGDIEERFRKKGINLFKFAEDSYKLKSFATFLIVLRLANYIRKHKIQIIHTHTFNAQVWGGLAGRLTGVKVIEHVHDMRYIEPEEVERRHGYSNYQYKFVDKVKELSDVTVVLTEQNQEFLLQHKLKPQNRIRKFYNGIPVNGHHPRVEVRDQILKRFSLPADALIILTPIRLATEKNAELVISIAPQVIAHIPNAYFLIAGDGPLFSELQEKIKTLGLEKNVKLVGYHSDVTHLLQGTDIFLLPSFLELHSIAILEAMSMKVPVVISSGVGCHGEFIQNWQNGVLLDPFNDKEWADAVVQLLLDPQFRKEMGEAGYRTCREQFNINNTIKNFENLYDELTA